MRGFPERLIFWQPYIEHEYSDTLLITLLKRHFPEQYRERQQVDHSGEVNSNFTLPLSLLKAIQEQRQRVIAADAKAPTMPAKAPESAKTAQKC